MALASVKEFVIKGIVNVLPKNKASNRGFNHLDQQQTDELIKHTGIENRRICNDDSENVKTYAKKGIEILLNKLNWQIADIKVMVFVTQSPELTVPSVSCQLHGELKMNIDTLCFDINSGCSGYVYGLHTVGSLLASLPNNSKAILCCGDFSSRLIEPGDTATQPIFSDAVSVTAFEKNECDDVSHFNLQTDGSGQKVIYLEKKEHSQNSYMRLNGIDVFNYSVKMVPQNITNLLIHSGVGLNDVDLFVFHQANKLINNMIARSLNLPASKTPETLSIYGNTASASIPITLASSLPKSKDRKYVLMCGFGVGFSTASALVKVQDLFIQNIEV